MFVSKQSPAPGADRDPLELAEAKLRQELRGMFEIDTQQNLQDYLDLVTNLQPQTWTNDIQSLYRAIHTIKGSAVTVGADATLYLATTLEDMLSDLRYLDPAPPLADRDLQEILSESGELLAATLALKDKASEAARASVEPSQQRLLALREQIQANYLLGWTEQKQLHQDFANQGFDLVTLDLEIALKQLSAAGLVPASALALAEELLMKFVEIGQDLELASGWDELISQARGLFKQPECAHWKVQWLAYFDAFKASLRAGGTFVPVGVPEVVGASTAPAVEAAPLGEQTQLPQLDLAERDSSELLDALSFLDEFDTDTDTDSDLNAANKAPASEGPALQQEGSDEIEFFAETDNATNEIAETLPSSAIATPETIPDATASTDPSNSRIPVPLERLERSARTSIATVLSLRSAQGAYQELHSCLTQLITIARESSQYIHQLRELENDYALEGNKDAALDKLEALSTQPHEGPVLERYRRGYTAINRLLEMNLRLSELGAETEKISQQTAKGLQSLDRDILQLQTTIEESRLVSFQTLAFRARATLRHLCIRCGKPAELEISGARTELDVGIVQQLEAILLHLLRNAYDHGLESPVERKAAGKPTRGTVHIALQRQGNSYRLTLSDDGRGIDAEAIRDRAIALNLPMQDVGTAAELLAVLCQPGFSSSAAVSAISGRGVGMDVVATGIAQLGGSLQLQTTPGRGSTFTCTIPVPHLLVPCVLFQAGEIAFAIPTEEIETTQIFENLNATPIAVEGYGGIWEVTDAAGKTIPAIDLLTYWQPNRSRRSFEDTAICAFVRSPINPKGIWLFADDLLGQADLPVETLPAPLAAPSGLLGTSLLGNGSLVPVLETTTLARFLVKITSTPATAPSGTKVVPDLKYDDRILIVDDAALMRRRLEASLTASGYSTHTCADGLEAWNWLQTNPAPRLIVTDIEMPEMDGFTLINRCRQNGLSTPVLVVSSRISEEWRREARRLGATDYLTKGFSTTELLEKVSNLVDRKDYER